MALLTSRSRTARGFERSHPLACCSKTPPYRFEDQIIHESGIAHPLQQMGEGDIGFDVVESADSVLSTPTAQRHENHDLVPR